jgi:geranylgeranyl diphosphate synthase type II
MYTLDELSERINGIIRELDIPKSPDELYEPIRYILGLGGKRIRPVLALMSANLFKDDIDDALPPAVSIELFHNFTLIHDDIMDHAPVRRNHPTVHTKWNTNIGILSGDALNIYAYGHLLKSRKDKLFRLLEIFNETALEVCEGQQLDMNYETAREITMEEYLRMIRLKTAVLLAGAMKIGALVADATEEQIEHAYNCGMNLGMAFQIQDDYLDTYGDANLFGKTIGGDILSNKKTFLLVHAMEVLPPELKEQLFAEMDDPEPDKEKKIAAIRELFNKANIPEVAKKKMDIYYEKGMKELKDTGVPADRRVIIEELAEKLVSRTK